MLESFVDWRPSTVSRLLLTHIETVLAAYKEQGYILTLRQLYYQLVAGDLLPKQWADPATGSTNNVSSYKRLGNIVNRGRLAGLIDWNMIEDRNRTVQANSHWNSPKSILNTAAKSFYMDHWVDQEKFVFVMAEKDAVSNIVEPICSKYDVQYMANKGYSSQSAMYRLYQRVQTEIYEGKEIICIYLGDFDPSGLDMDRDIFDRMNLFLGFSPSFGQEFPIKRIALTMPQIKEYKPPENPAKVTDTRYAAYVEKHGEKSWELDAIKPNILAEMLEDEILEHVDMEKFEKIDKQQEEWKKEMLEFANGWED